MNILIWVLSIGIALFQAVDGWTTYKALTGGGTELNPIMAGFLKNVGLVPGLIFTKGSVAAMAVAGAYFGIWNSTIGLALLAILFVFYGAIVTHNLEQYKKG